MVEMGHTIWKSVSTVFIILLLVLTVSTSTYAQQAYTSSTMVLKVYEDGVVQVEHGIETDVTYPIVNVLLFGEIYENLIVVDQDGIPLDYALTDGGIAVDTLGAGSVKITYFTSDLTSKAGRIWTLTADSSINTDVILPGEATIISLNQSPTAIKNVDGQTLLTMPEGQLEITYIIEITATPTPEEFPYYWILGAAAAIALIVIIVLVVFRFRAKPKPSENVKEKRAIDVEKIFSQKPQLRAEDREVVQFIGECGGEVFETEIRKRFKLPRTTVWRMMQRLEREGVADILKIGGQNLIRIKPKYQVKRETV